MDQGCLQIDRSAPTVYPRSDGFNSGRPRRRPMQLARRSFPPLIHGHSTRRVHACSPYIKHSTSPLSLALPLKISFIFHARGLLSFIRPPRTSSGTYSPPRPCHVQAPWQAPACNSALQGIRVWKATSWIVNLLIRCTEASGCQGTDKCVSVFGHTQAGGYMVWFHDQLDAIFDALCRG